jgi:hypothetical protein
MEPDFEPPPELIDRYMPDCDVAECHELHVHAPARITYDAAYDMRLSDSALIRLIMGIRTLPSRLRGRAVKPLRRTLLAETISLGWRVLDEIPGRAIAVGASCKPWEAEVKFRGLAPEEFALFREPGHAKIVWTLEAEPLGEGTSLARTQTRVLTTDPDSLRRFRRYWRIVRPGVVLIRLLCLRLVKTEAERRARMAGSTLRMIRPRDKPRWYTGEIIVP